MDEALFEAWERGDLDAERIVGEPHDAVFRQTVVPPTARCCGRLYWYCECPSICDKCNGTVHGQGLCGDCYGGA